MEAHARRVTARLRFVGGLALLVAQASAFAQSASYAFSGTVTSATGVYAAAGPAISGTFTVNLSAPGTVTGVIGSQTGSWELSVFGEPAAGDPTPTVLPFSATLVTGGQTYGTSPVSNIMVTNSIDAVADVGGAEYAYSLGEWNGDLGTNYTVTSIQLLGSTPTWSTTGLPVPAKVTGCWCSLASYTNGASVGTLTFTLASIAALPAPVAEGDRPIPVWALGALGVALSGVASRRLAGRPAGRMPRSTRARTLRAGSDEPANPGVVADVQVAPLTGHASTARGVIGQRPNGWSNSAFSE
jgi:hypothetical protein